MALGEAPVDREIAVKIDIGQSIKATAILVEHIESKCSNVDLHTMGNTNSQYSPLA